MSREAVLLVNMGGPECAAQVKPYLREIFRDPEILPLPGILRLPLAALIANMRAGKVISRYNLIGGKSPLGKWTRAQARELAAALKREDRDVPVRYAFRYSAPFIDEALESLAREGIADVTIVPLFPHYTAAMTGSVLKEVARAAERTGIRWKSLPAFGNTEPVLELWARYLRRSLDIAGEGARVMFVAHGIPLRNVRRGDPYPQEVTASAQALAATLPDDIEWTLCYQSKVGPVEWTGPYLEGELQRLATSSAPLVIMPLSFVADCLETLYDLDIVALEATQRALIEKTVRVRVFNDDPQFAEAICKLMMRKHEVSSV